MGSLDSLPETKEAGAIYFAKDGNKNFGELYYDDENNIRVKIAPKITEILFPGDNPELQLLYEDATNIATLLPQASDIKGGIVTINDQVFKGSKTFLDSIIFGYKLTDNNIKTCGSIKGLYNNNKDYLSIIFDSNAIFNITNNDNTINFSMVPQTEINMFVRDDARELISSIQLAPGIGLYTEQLGNISKYINTAYITNIYTQSITGTLIGNADTATKFYSSTKINDTDYDGSTDITTNTWGYARTINISDEAGETGTLINGSEETYTLIIPNTLINFQNITSTNLFGTNLGSSENENQWVNLYIKNPYVYNVNGTYYNLLTSTATANRTLILPDDNGELVYHANNTQIGSTQTPVYIEASGKVTACGQISVKNGGTGKEQIALGDLMLGAGYNSDTINTLTPGTKGQLLVSNGPGVMPSYISPSFSWNDTTLNLNINGAITSTTLPNATATAAGIVTTGNQTFGGVKTFNSINVNNTLSVTNNATFSNSISVASNIVLGGNITTSGTNSQIKMSEGQVEIDTPSLYLNGDIIKLGPDNYGDELPTTGLTEGRIFFLLTPEE